MGFVQTLFRLVFPIRRITPEQREEQEEEEVKTLLRAMVNLEEEGIIFPYPREIQAKLRHFGNEMKKKDLLVLIEKCVRLGYVQKIGYRYPQYAISPNGCNHLGFSSDHVRRW